MTTSTFRKLFLVIVCTNYECYIMMIELTLLKELMLIKQVHQKSVIFATIGIFKTEGLSFNRMSAACVMIC